MAQSISMQFLSALCGSPEAPHQRQCRAMLCLSLAALEQGPCGNAAVVLAVHAFLEPGCHVLQIPFLCPKRTARCI